MPVTIRNRTQRPIHFTLTSGPTMRLGPGQTSGELPDVEIKNNAKVEKLQSQNTIEITRSQESAPPAPQPAAAGPAGEDAGGERQSSRRRAG